MVTVHVFEQWSDMESKENVFEGVVNNIEEERSQQTLQSIVALLMLWEPSGGWDNVWKTLGTVFVHLTVLVPILSDSFLSAVRNI